MARIVQAEYTQAGGGVIWSPENQPGRRMGQPNRQGRANGEDQHSIEMHSVLTHRETNDIHPGNAPIRMS
jgi:hypothetical protein